MTQPNPNMTYEELREQVTELLREMYHPSDQILKEDVPKIIQLFATLCAEVIARPLPKGVDPTCAKLLETAQSAALAQLTTKNTNKENV